MDTLGQRLASKLIDEQRLVDQFVSGDISSRIKLLRRRIRLTVTWEMASRANDYTFVCGGSAALKQINNTVGKAAWTEVAANDD